MFGLVVNLAKLEWCLWPNGYIVFLLHTILYVWIGGEFGEINGMFVTLLNLKSVAFCEAPTLLQNSVFGVWHVSMSETNMTLTHVVTCQCRCFIGSFGKSLWYTVIHSSKLTTNSNIHFHYPVFTLLLCFT
jgi:hypothetical protein